MIQDEVQGRLMGAEQARKRFQVWALQCFSSVPTSKKIQIVWRLRTKAKAETQRQPESREIPWPLGGCTWAEPRGTGIGWKEVAAGKELASGVQRQWGWGEKQWSLKRRGEQGWVMLIRGLFSWIPDYKGAEKWGGAAGRKIWSKRERRLNEECLCVGVKWSRKEGNG